MQMMVALRGLGLALILGVATTNAQVAPFATCEDFYEASCPIMEYNQVHKIKNINIIYL